MINYRVLKTRADPCRAFFSARCRECYDLPRSSTSQRAEQVGGGDSTPERPENGVAWDIRVPDGSRLRLRRRYLLLWHGISIQLRNARALPKHTEGTSRVVQ